MESIKKTLCIACKYMVEQKYIFNVCNKFFGNYLDIFCCSYDEIKNLNVTPDAFIVTSFTEAIVSERYPNTKQFFSDRSVTGANLELLITVPKGNKVLIVNSPKYSALDSVKKLNKVNVKGLELVPYWPGSDLDYSDFEYAAYFGVETYVPDKKFKSVINLGSRTLTNSVIIDIITYFKLPYSIADEYGSETIERLVDRATLLNETLKEVERSNSNLALACDMNKNAIFAFDEDGNISIFNNSATAKFGISRENAIGKKYTELFANIPELIEMLTNDEEGTDIIVNIGDEKAMFTSLKYSARGKLYTVVSIAYIADIQLSESQIRRKLRRQEFTARYTFKDIKGDSSKIVESRQLANMCAKSDATILITGESGTGKELFAQSIHNASNRAEGPFVGINFAALPETLAESELFGYEEGAFTGAVKGGKQGLFEIAHNGTIFLDEIGDASLAVQSKLLRVLEEREVVRVGGTKIIPVNVRVVCATNKDLKKMVEEGKFRGDLYYRIKVLTFEIPPLRQRKEDLIPLIKSMLGNENYDKFIDDEIRQIVLSSTWPGNVRELKSICEYIKVLGLIKKQGKIDDISIKSMLRTQLMNNLEFENDPIIVQNDNEALMGTPCELLDEELLVILRAIERLKAQGKNVGRKSISLDHDVIAFGLTEFKIKSRLVVLAKEGYISVGTTKQGTKLTEKGKRTLMLTIKD